MSHLPTLTMAPLPLHSRTDAFAFANNLFFNGGHGSYSYYDDDRPKDDNESDQDYSRDKVPTKPKYDPMKKSGIFESNPFFKNQRQIGATLVVVGTLLTFIGMALFFEGNLLRLGNISIITGVPLLVGPNRVRQFFFQKSRSQATIITSLGIFLVLIGRPRMGIICEVFGLMNLFGNMLPLLYALAKRLPIIGDVLSSFEDSGVRNPQKRYGNY